MAFNNFIPALWTARLLDNLNNAHVYAKCVNRDYEGEIKGMGSSLKIASIGRVTINNYTRNADINAPELLNDGGEVLLIDQGKYFNFAVDDVDEVQAKPAIMDAAMEEASWGLSDVADQFLAALLVAGVATGTPDNDFGSQGSPITVGTGGSDTNAYDQLVKMDVKLSESNTPTGGRWAVVPPWYEGMLRRDQRFVSYGTDANRRNLRGEPIGEAAGFTIYKSNNVPVTSSVFRILAGYKGAATYAEQIDKVEAFRPERRFADAVKGLQVYGAKVTRPSNLALTYAQQGT